MPHLSLPGVNIIPDQGSIMYEIGRNKHKVTVAYLPNLNHQYDLPQVVDQAPKGGNLVGGWVLTLVP